MPVEVVVSALAGGASLEEVTEAYAITVEQVQTCLAFAEEVAIVEGFYRTGRYEDV